MLWQRVLTALVLLPLVVAGVWYLPTAYLAAIFAVFVLLGVRELAQMTGYGGAPALALAVLSGLLQWLLWRALPAEATPLLLLFDALLWLGLAALLFGRRRPLPRLTGRRPATLLLGLCCLLLAWLAVVWLHQREQGAVLLLSLLVLVWLADSAAYFTGRAFGKRKLAPMISPGKTLAGLGGALAAAAVFGAALGRYGWFPGHGAASVALLYVAVAFISVAGDLAESAVKRQAGVKDSGQLLPGHGGVLDRIDSLIAAAPLFAVLLWWLEGAA